jgi:4-alpha-glucanotransferase
MTSDTARAVETTAALYGVEAAWVDAEGHRRTASTEVVLDVLGRLGAPVAGEADLADAARVRRRAIWERACPPVRVVAEGEAPTVPLRLPAGRARGPLSWNLVCERGDGRPGALRPGGEVWSGVLRVEALDLAGGGSVDGRSFEIRRLDLPADLPRGYHRLTMRHGAAELRAHVIVAPHRVFRGGRLDGRWGIFHPLYGLRDDRLAGVGDLCTLRHALEWTAARGGAAFGTTPLVALFAEPPVDPSPYAPASRLFWDDRIVDLEAAPGYAETRASGELDVLDGLAAHRHDELVPGDALSRSRDAALAVLSSQFFGRGGGGGGSHPFERFLAARPEAGDFARFLVARETWGRDWRAWPEPARSGRLPSELLDERRVRRHLFGQWLATRQIEALGGAGAGPGTNRADRSTGEDDGRTVLYLDVPLGSHPDGYDVWRRRELFASGVAAGAPPDEFFRGGQDWGLPPLHPERIREDGFAYFAAVLRHAMRPAGLLRIDHVMQLHRLFWIPAGATPADGVYVRYPADEMASVVALESHRAFCEVAGEDLGTVPDAVRELMDRRGIRRTSVLGFSLDEAASGAARLDVPADAVATIGTHDMVPLAGLREAVDIDEREALGLLAAGEASALRARRADAFRGLDERFGVAASAGAGPDPLLAPLLAGLGASDAGLVVVSLDDLFGVRAPQNVPGTGAERPNWRRRLPSMLDDSVPAEAERVFAVLRATRPRAAVAGPTPREVLS